MVTGGGFEDQLYARRTSSGGEVHCRQAIASSVFGGSATLAWEPFPGAVAYVGYSGSALDAKAIAAMRRLAGRCRVLNGADWRAARPEVRDQNNEVT